MSDIRLSTKASPKCVRCGRDYADHTAKHRRCPIGSRHRTLGFTQFHRNQHYKARADVSVAEPQASSLPAQEAE